MGYSEDPQIVRVDFFLTDSGKWLTTEEVRWDEVYYFSNYTSSIQEAFAIVLREHFKDNPKRLSNTDAVCLDPYYEFPQPVCLKNGAWITDTHDSSSCPSPGYNQANSYEPS